MELVMQNDFNDADLDKDLGVFLEMLFQMGNALAVKERTVIWGPGYGYNF